MKKMISLATIMVVILSVGLASCGGNKPAPKPVIPDVPDEPQKPDNNDTPDDPTPTPEKKTYKLTLKTEPMVDNAPIAQLFYDGSYVGESVTLPNRNVRVSVCLKNRFEMPIQDESGKILQYEFEKATLNGVAIKALKDRIHLKHLNVDLFPEKDMELVFYYKTIELKKTTITFSVPEGVSADALQVISGGKFVESNKTELLEGASVTFRVDQSKLPQGKLVHQWVVNGKPLDKNQFDPIFYYTIEYKDTPDNFTFTIVDESEKPIIVPVFLQSDDKAAVTGKVVYNDGYVIPITSGMNFKIESGSKLKLQAEPRNYSKNKIAYWMLNGKKIEGSDNKTEIESIMPRERAVYTVEVVSK